MQAKLNAAENKFSAAKNELANARLEITTVDREYNEKIAKAESDKFSTLSMVNTGEGDVSKLKNQFQNYAIRSGFYYVLAPQDGQINQTVKAGIGEVVKDGAMLVRIIPQQAELAVEMYVAPIDLPIIHPGEKVRFQFDGWPSIFFSGWPNASVGTFGGVIIAIDNNISENGKFRILVKPDKDDHPWPKELKLGGGAQGFALLGRVTIIYELWRQMNGFPPDYYLPKSNGSDSKKKDK